jgi:hypothetical protein
VQSDQHLDVNIAGSDVRVRAPRAVLDVMDHLLARVQHEHIRPPHDIQVLVDVSLSRGVWQVRGTSPNARKALDESSPLPHVAGAAVSAVLADVRAVHGLCVWRATALAWEQSALVLAGADWGACITLAAHLHAGGWRILGGDYTIVDGATVEVIPFEKALHANSASISSFPVRYRAAVEASPWYSNTHTIAFYAIDPTLVAADTAFGERARLRAVVAVDGAAARTPSLAVHDDLWLTDVVEAAGLGDAAIATAALVRGPFVETAELLGRWFRSIDA